ncbi:MAG: hypothetical protein WC602_03505 [archaeon]
MIQFRRITLLPVIIALLVTVQGISQEPARQMESMELLQKIRDMKEKTKKERENLIYKLKTRIDPLLQYNIEELNLVLSIKVRNMYGGSAVIADNSKKTYLGQIDDEFSSESIFNEYGTYGNKYASQSIWNEYGQYGGMYSSYSPFNNYSSIPPLIVKNGQVIGRLTVNKYLTIAVDPNWLKVHFTY